MVCKSCGKKPKNTAKDFTKAVVEINNPEKLVLFRKVVVPASMGTEEDFPASVGKYYNVLLQYEANGDTYLYSSDGIPTMLSSDVSELQHQLEQLGIKVDGEILARISGDNALSNAIAGEKTARENADTALGNRITALDGSLATVAKTGNYNDLTNKPTIGNATLTIKRNNTNVGTFTANATTNKSIDISVPTKTSDIANDGADGSSTYVENDELSAVATSGSYNDLLNKPTIGNATLTIKKNNTNVGTFTANATSNKSIDITVPTKTSELTNDGSDNTSTYVEADELATVATTGSYPDLHNKPTIGNGTLTIQRNSTQLGTFKANATSGTTVDISVPTKTSDLVNDGADGTSTFVEADDLPTVDTTYSASSNNAIANSTVTNSLNRDVMTNLALDTNPSTTTINLNNTKTNLASPSSTTTTAIALPVASSTQAGVMNSSTFDAVTSNTSNINALLNGAVAVTGLPTSPSQSDITTAWQTETGLSTLINRASVYDVTNNKVWTYYTNDTTWHAASNTSQVTVNTFTNSSEGVIKGSTNTGQVFAENDGTGSVNGWDSLSGTVADHTSKLATIEQGAEVNVQSNWTQTNTTADDYIKNKPANLVQDANYVHTDNNFTTTLKNKLDGIESGAEVNQNAFSNVSVNGVTVAADAKTDTLTLTAGTNVTLTGDASSDTVTISSTDTNTTYSFANGTNGFTVTPSGGSAQTITVTPSIADATTTDDGLMSAADKVKLNSIASGAEVNVQSDWNVSDNTSDAYIKNKPTIPTVNNATLTIQKNGTDVQTFTANSSENKTANITVPTAVSELTNDANYATTTQLSDGLATKQNTLTAGNAIDITNNVISADVYPADFFTSTTETKSGTGTSVTLTDVTTAPLALITPKGDTSQQTYTGKNVFNINTTPSWIGADTTYSVSGNTLHVEGKWFVGILTPVEANTNYYVSALRKNVASVNRAGYISVYGGYNTDMIAEFQTGNGTFNSGNRTSVYLVFYSDSGNDIGSADFENIQLEKGTTGTDYEPYVGGTASPNPDYPQDVKVVTGEQTVEVHTDNLLNINFTNTTRNGLTYTNNGDGTITISGTTDGASDGFNISPYSSSKPLVLKKNTYYTQRVEVVSGSQGPIAVVPSFKNSSGTIVWNYFSNNGGRLTEDVMTNNNYNVYWQGTGKQVNVTLRIWLVEGYDLETPFVPFGSQKYEVNLGKNLFNTVDRTQNRMSMDCGTTNNRVTVNGTPTRNNFGGSYWNLNGTDDAPANYYNYDNTTSGTKLPAGTYTLSIHDISGSYTSPSSVQLFVTKVYSGSYPIPTLATITLTNNQTSATFTLAEETTVKIQFRVAVSSDTSVAVPVFNNYSFNLQLERGSRVTQYAPFMSKNLLDPARMVDGYVASDGTIVQVNNTGDMATPYFIPVAPNSTLTFTIFKTTGTNAPWFGMCEYSSADESSFITRQVDQTAGITSATFTVGSTTKYVRVSARNMNVATEYQLEIGETSTAYEPYSIELCKIGDYQDYFYKGSDGWYFHKIFGKLVVWPKQISNYNDHSSSNYITINYNYRLVKRLSTIEATTASNRFIGATITQTWSGSVINGVSQPTNGTYLQFSLPASAGSSLAEVQSYFESRETEAYFLLENPIDIKIVNADLISQLEALANANSYRGTTHIDTASDGYNLPMILTSEAFTNTLVGITEVIDGKQNKLTAGSNITITNNTISATDTTYSVMTGASAGSAGASGLVPAPSAGDQDKVLKGDGTWGTVSTGSAIITMTSTDPGEGQPLQADHFIAVYEV